MAPYFLQIKHGVVGAKITPNLLVPFLIHQVSLLAASDKHHPLPCISASVPLFSPARNSPATYAGPCSPFPSEPTPTSLLYKEGPSTCKHLFFASSVAFQTFRQASALFMIISYLYILLRPSTDA